MTEERHEGDIDRELDDPVFEELFAAMRATARRPAPPMSPALTMLLAPGAAGRRRRARGATVGLAVVGVLAGGVGAAAATGHLPRPAPVTRVAGDPTDAVPTAPGASTGTVAPPSTEPTPTPDPEVTDGEDPATVVAGEPTTPPTSRPRATDDGDDSRGSGGTGSGDGESDEADTPSQDDASDDPQTQEPGADEHPDDGGAVDDGSGGDEGSSGSGDVPDEGESPG